MAGVFQEVQVSDCLLFLLDIFALVLFLIIHYHTLYIIPLLHAYYNMYSLLQNTGWKEGDSEV